MKHKHAILKMERIFSHAVGLQQSGRLRNAIFCIKNFIYIMNQDHTILMRFWVAQPFEKSMGMYANDYESNNFKPIDNGSKIVFTTKDGAYIKKKTCKAAHLTPIKVHKLFKRLNKQFKQENGLNLTSQFLKMLNDGLQHIEFKIKKGKFLTIQRDIYSGTFITVERVGDESKLMKDKKLKDFGPTGIRTNDFVALFSFSDSITFYFTGKNTIWFQSNDPKMPFTGVLSQCIYDELGKVE